MITPYLWRFSISAVLLTVLFRYALSYSIKNELYTMVVITSVVYGSLMFIIGWVFGKMDSEYLPIFDTGFRFHLSTYIIHNSISIFWLFLEFGSKNESISIAFSVATFWGVFIVIHFIVFLLARKRTINNLDKDNIFD